MKQSKEIFSMQLFEIIKKYGFNSQELFYDLTLFINDAFSVSEPLKGTSDIKKKIDLFLVSKKIDGLSSETLKDYKNQLYLFADKVNIPVNKISTDDIRAYIGYLCESRKLKDGSLLTYTNILKSFFSWLTLEEIIKKNPCLKIKAIRVDRNRSRHALNAEELEQLRNACNTAREKALVEFLYSTGCRLSEVLNVRTGEIDFISRSVKVIGKGDKERTVYFSVKAKLFLQEYIKAKKGTSEYLFTSSVVPYEKLKARTVQQEIQYLGERANIKYRVHPHLLRHTFATNALKSGMDITIIQKLLGHSNVSTTQIYAEINQDIVMQAYNKILA